MKTIFWNVDTQYDFMRDNEEFKGALAVPDAQSIESNLDILKSYAAEKDIQVVNTADWHTYDSKEFSDNPDFTDTFPPHCLQGTKGAEYVTATNPDNAYAIGWDTNGFDEEQIRNTRNITIRKDAFDVFEGNPNTEEILRTISPDRAVVYGVATNYCVNFAVKGLVERGIEVYVVGDAIKEIPMKGEPDNTLNTWKDLGVKIVKTKDYLRI